MDSCTTFMDEQGRNERDIVCIIRLFAGYKQVLTRFVEAVSVSESGIAAVAQW